MHEEDRGMTQDRNYEFTSDSDSVRVYVIETHDSPEAAQRRAKEIQDAIGALCLEGRSKDSIKITAEPI